MRYAASLIAPLTLAILVICTVQLPPARAEIPEFEITWSGEVFVNESIIIQRNQTLIIKPGTTVNIQEVVASCTESNLPMLTIGGRLLARGTPQAPVRFVSVSSTGESSTVGREAVLIYGGANITSELSNTIFRGGALMLNAAQVRMFGCVFDLTYVGLSNDQSVIENCSFGNSPLYIFGNSTTAVRNSAFYRTSRDDVGIHIANGVRIENNTISDCHFGIEAPNWISAAISDNVITGCNEGVHSGANLSFTDNVLTGNTVGLNSSFGLEYSGNNTIAGNELGIVTFGTTGMYQNDIFSTGSLKNRRADIQQKMLVEVDVSDGNGQNIVTQVKLTDRFGTTAFNDMPTAVFLVGLEQLPDGSVKTYTPYRARAEYRGVFNETVINAAQYSRANIRLEILPDLELAAVTGLESRLEEDEIVVINITIQNTGKVGARDFTMVVYVDGIVAFQRNVRVLEPGEMRAPYDFYWKATPGKHTFKTVIDSANRVSEVQETDNTKTITTEVKATPVLQYETQPYQLMLLLIVSGVILFGVAGKR